MASMYGHRWTTAYGDEVDPDGVWAATLDGIEWQYIRKGLGEIAKRGDDWPPSAPEFRRICSGESEHWAHRVMAAKDADAPKALPQKRDPEVIRKGAELLREARKGLI